MLLAVTPCFMRLSASNRERLLQPTPQLSVSFWSLAPSSPEAQKAKTFSTADTGVGYKPLQTRGGGAVGGLLERRRPLEVRGPPLERASQTALFLIEPRIGPNTGHGDAEDLNASGKHFSEVGPAQPAPVLALPRKNRRRQSNVRTSAPLAVRRPVGRPPLGYQTRTSLATCVMVPPRACALLSWGILYISRA